MKENQGERNTPCRGNRGFQGRLLLGFGLAVLCGGVGNGQSEFQFQTGRRTFPLVESNPARISLADFDGDEVDDALVTDTITGTVRCFFGDPRGRFVVGPTTSLALSHFDLLTADFDGDGRCDVATAGVLNGGVSGGIAVGYGDGTGRFSSPIAIPLPTFNPGELAWADVDGDGIEDLLVVLSSRDTLGILPGDGSGGFGALAETGAGPAPRDLVLGDFDGDDTVDVVIGNTPAGGGVSFLRGNGVGFDPPVFFGTDGGVSFLVARDLDGDGDLDVAFSQYEENRAGWLMGDGAGGFSGLQFFPELLSRPLTVLSEDFDADGLFDLAVLYGSSNGDRAAIYRGDGTGGFSQLSEPTGGHDAVHMVAADFDRNCRIDLLIANRSSDDLTLALNTGRGEFDSATPIATQAAGSRGVAVGDYDEDGHVDLASATSQVGEIEILLGDGFGGYGFGAIIAAGIEGDLLTADFDGDGHLDLAGTKSSTDRAVILWGDGQGGFGAPSEFVAGINPRAIVSGDFDQNGFPDLAIAGQGSGCDPIECNFDGDARVFLNDGFGGMVQSAVFAQGVTRVTQLHPGDFNQDGNPDIVVQATGLGLRLFEGDGAGGFTLGTDLEGGGNLRDLLSADFDGDGKLDLAWTEFRVLGPASVVVRLGSGSGTFSSPQRYDVLESPEALVEADFDGDGDLDLVVGNSRRDVVSDPLTVLEGDGAGGFTPFPVHFGAGNEPTSLVAIDGDEDGQPDVLAVNGRDEPLTLLFNRSSSHILGRRGNVNAKGGGITDVLFVNGSAGHGVERRLVVDAAGPLTFEMAAPPSRPGGPSPWAAYAYLGEPTPELLSPLPFDLGLFCHQTFLTDPWPKNLLAIWNNAGRPELLGFETFRSSPAPDRFLEVGAIGQEVTIFLQGLIKDRQAPNGRAAVTNGVVVEARF